MNSSTPSMVYVRRGKTTSNNVRSCDTVRAGAFFPQVQLQVPQKEMRQHCRQHMVVPAGIFAHFITLQRHLQNMRFSHKGLGGVKHHFPLLFVPGKSLFYTGKFGQHTKVTL
jgi:hypothetical protein